MNSLSEMIVSEIWKGGSISSDIWNSPSIAPDYSEASDYYLFLMNFVGTTSFEGNGLPVPNASGLPENVIDYPKSKKNAPATAVSEPSYFDAENYYLKVMNFIGAAEI